MNRGECEGGWTHPPVIPGRGEATSPESVGPYYAQSGWRSSGSYLHLRQKDEHCRS